MSEKLNPWMLDLVDAHAKTYVQENPEATVKQAFTDGVTSMISECAWRSEHISRDKVREFILYTLPGAEHAIARHKLLAGYLNL